MDFDRAAQTYDHDFTNTPIGRMLRKSVLRYMDGLLKKNPEIRILEFNAGTGEDAIYFGLKGYQVSATDISAKMVEKAEKKVNEFGLPKLVNVSQCDIKNIAEHGFKMEYDVVFSNFGGLNCLNPSEIEKLNEDILHLLKPGGRFIAVVMPRFCFWESLYFLLKFNKKAIFRRNTTENIPVMVNGIEVKTWYYSPKVFYTLMQNNFRRIKLRPVGFLIPPSYLGPAFDKRMGLLKLLCKADKVLERVSFLAPYSDHFLIDLERVN